MKRLIVADKKRKLEPRSSGVLEHVSQLPSTLPLLALAAAAVISPLAASATVHFAIPPLIDRLRRTGSTVVDVLKPDGGMVPRPAGPVLTAGFMVAGAVAYAAFQSVEILAVMLTALSCFVVGYVDDKRVMGGWFKPVALAAAASPILLLGAYDSNLSFPLFGDTRIPILYLALAPLMICITGNTANSIDVMNGLLSGFMAITGAALTAALVILQNYEMAVISLSLVAVSAAYYRYHRIPCRIFPGDSGALMLGGAYGAIAICGGVEIVAAVAMLPAIINSFLFLASVKRIVEHRQVAKKSTVVTDDFRIKCSGVKGASISLVGLIAGPVPHTEAQVVSAVFKLAAISSGLAVLTALMMTWSIGSGWWPQA